MKQKIAMRVARLIEGKTRKGATLINTWDFHSLIRRSGGKALAIRPSQLGGQKSPPQLIGGEAINRCRGGRNNHNPAPNLNAVDWEKGERNTGGRKHGGRRVFRRN